MPPARTLEAIVPKGITKDGYAEDEIKFGGEHCSARTETFHVLMTDNYHSKTSHP